ncbi:MAG: lipoate--protein ligase family protein [Desulfarculus sp.]|nr:MAG: lipoate--protein ligase family protein [Desulfarculus sp.]
MHLYALGQVPWQDSQLAYHALAHLGREGLILCSPQEPYVCLGYSQDPAQELDLEHCRAVGLPLFRREVGGGTVYLDKQQVFWQMVLRRDNALVPRRREVFFSRFLAPVVAAYRALGVEARLAPPNEVAVGRRKIAGIGAGEIGECLVLVGNLMRSFDCAAMARVLRAPSPEFRRLYRRSMEANLTSIRRELGPVREAAVSDQALYDLLSQSFAQALGPLTPAGQDQAWQEAMGRLAGRMLSPQWINFRRKARPGRKVKVRAGLFLHQVQQDTPRGPWQALFTSEGGRVSEADLYAPGQDREALRQRARRELVGLSVAQAAAAVRALAEQRA